ncbi:MAG: hypothetical protein PHI94_02855 [Eubacteriaceae bacterium]|nr:hypothetical protein [Eubacteriaceae bacterium]MDD4507543.1 hypothetical protein [Eubacteriaceae bacterium]
MKTIDAFVQQFNGREYKKEITPAEIDEAARAGLIIVFGKSDDTTVLHGAIEAECSTNNGGSIYLTEDGLFEECPCDCIHARRAKAKAKSIQVNWCKGPYVWSYQTDIPHQCFEIIDNQPSENLKFCQGIIFKAADLL